MPTNDRTAAEIERDLERERAQLGITIESLVGRMSVEHITAELSQQLRTASTDALRGATDRIADNARSNPAAAALAGAGILWLMLGQKHGSDGREDPPPTFPPERVRRARAAAIPPTTAGAPSDDASGTFGDHTRDIGRDAWASLQDGVSDLRGRIAEGTENLAEEGKARVIEAREAAIAAAESAVDSAKAKVRPVIQSVEENPWAYGGIALALGAAVAGAFMYRKAEEDARQHRNDVFAEADRIWREESERETIDRNAAVAGSPPPSPAVG